MSCVTSEENTDSCSSSDAVAAPRYLQRLLDRSRQGCQEAQSEIAELVHPDFYRIATRLCSGQAFSNSLHATHLVNETFLRLFEQGVFRKSPSTRYLFVAAGRTMRNVIADYLRQRRPLKRGYQQSRIPLERVIDDLLAQPFPMEELNEALDELARISPRRAEIVYMRFFFRMTVSEAAQFLKVSQSTVEKEWRAARVWLFERLND